MLAVPPISYQHTLNVFNFATAPERYTVHNATASFNEVMGSRVGRNSCAK
jgi:L-cystine uptake protein TcyP (sodium:dicarboxylate symporter family)